MYPFVVLPLVIARLPLAHAEDAHAAANVVAARIVRGADAERSAGLAGEHVFADGTGIEVAMSVASGADGVAVPVEVVLAHVWHVGPAFEPFVGVGPTVEAFRRDGALFVDWGAVGALGSHVWLGRHLGVAAELDVNVSSHAPVGAEWIVGPVFRWDAPAARPS